MNISRKARTTQALTLGAVLTGVFGIGAGCGGGDTPGTGMNVLVITLDTTRPDRISCYGGQPGLTPAIDDIAAQGVRFDRAISTAGITPMSHSSILTGLNNYAHGMRVFYSPKVSHQLKEAVDTLPEMLKGFDYATAARVSSYPVSEHYGLDQGFDDFESGVDLENLDLTKQQSHKTLWDSKGKTHTQRRGDFTTDSALEWLEANGTEGPWCMWMHMFDVHDYSIVPPDSFMERYGLEYPAPGTRLGMEGKIQWREAMYDPELAFMDMQIARVRAWLKENGQDENTIIVITADHGQGLRDGYERHGWMKHRLLYDWCVRVPLIVRVPGGASGGTVDAQVRTIDVVPTIMESLALPMRNPVEGDSLVALMNGGTENTPRVAYADALNDYDVHAPSEQVLPPFQHDNLFMACDGRWKLIWHESNPERSQLYDLLKDPQELQNLYAPGHDRAKALLAYLKDRRAMDVEPPGSGSKAPDVAALKGLGYGGDDEIEDEEPSDKGTDARDTDAKDTKSTTPK